ncbi:MAG: diaminopimelate epimerase [Chthoniobacterales bacterium]|nr:diaminopimelate epimerase [Chthoniobacterales bacterium]
MTTLTFTKMNGAGNDFIMLDNRQGALKLDPSQIKSLCDRHRRIGADGVLVLETEFHNKATPFRMRYYNADGYEAEMCGNGARCFTRYIADLLDKKTGKIAFETQAGLIEGELLDDQVKLLMSSPHHIDLKQSISLLNQPHIVHSINTGVPHAVIFVSDLTNAPVVAAGRELRYHPRFAPAGTNVNFVQPISDNSIALRTYERGVEEETLACGTGVVASALIYHLLHNTSSLISVLVKGGDTLQVAFVSQPSTNSHSIQNLSHVTLTGPADFVFTGTILIS